MNGDFSSDVPLVKAVRNDLEKVSHNRIEVAKIMDLKEKQKLRDEYFEKQGQQDERKRNLTKAIISLKAEGMDYQVLKRIVISMFGDEIDAQTIIKTVNNIFQRTD